MSFIHCRDRVNERYGVELEFEQYLSLRESTLEKQKEFELTHDKLSGFVAELANKRTIWKTDIAGKSVYCLFDPRTETLVTVLSRKQAHMDRKRCTQKVKTLNKRKPQHDFCEIY